MGKAREKKADKERISGYRNVAEEGYSVGTKERPVSYIQRVEDEEQEKYLRQWRKNADARK